MTATKNGISIAGVGTSDQFGFDLGKSPLRIQAEAFHAALADAGITTADVDGFITAKGAPRGVDYEEFAISLGLDLRWVSQLWAHGRWASTSILEAAAVITAGLADVVAIANASVSARGYGRHLTALGTGTILEGLRDVGGSHGENDIHGLDSPGGATALVARNYMQRYGATSDDLASIAIALRTHASRNPMAIMRDRPLDMDGYLREPMLVEPFRRADYCLSSEGATCLILMSAERAAARTSIPVRVAGGSGIRISRDDHVLFSRPGLGVGISREAPFTDDSCREVYDRAGVDRADVDALYVYDSFTSNVWTTLERFGFAEEGEAWSSLRENGMDLDSPLPINTHGGLHSEAHLLGYGHLIEMVRQLRGTAGARQVAGARVAQWATPRGDSIILTQES
jgi:acetyl-CoA acetyltransferase